MEGQTAGSGQWKGCSGGWDADCGESSEADESAVGTETETGSMTAAAAAIAGDDGLQAQRTRQQRAQQLLDKATEGWVESGN